jgi:hypothetical protein
MTNIAVVIAVSAYTSIPPLKACSQDGKIIGTLLKMNGRFEEVAIINGDQSAAQVKAELIEFITKFHNTSIDQFLFYFTGHGLFASEEVHLLLRDYDKNRPKQTSLENSELDNLVRPLTPSLYIKIVDACHSGISYIKSSNDFEKYMKGANDQFKKLYFMFSSQSDQKSYATDAMSYFTKSIVEAIARFEGPSIRYKDVIDFVSDYFTADSEQTPHFVTQADFTDIFCDINTTIKAEAQAFLNIGNPLFPPSKDGTQANSVISIVKEDAKNYCTQQEANESLNDTLKELSNVAMPDSLEELYEFELDPCNDTPVPNASAIGIWLAKQADDKPWFARVITEMITVKVNKKDPFDIAVFQNLGNPRIVEEQKKVISGFRSTVEIPYSYLSFSAKQKYPNLERVECVVVPIVSRTNVRLFWANRIFEFVAWDDQRPVGTLEYDTSSYPIKNREERSQIIQKIKDSFVKTIEERLSKKWPLPDRLTGNDGS